MGLGGGGAEGREAEEEREEHLQLLEHGGERLADERARRHLAQPPQRLRRHAPRRRVGGGQGGAQHVAGTALDAILAQTPLAVHDA